MKRIFTLLFLCLAASTFAVDSSVNVIGNVTTTGYKVLASTTIYMGDLVCVQDSSGYAKGCADAASEIFVGVAAAGVDNSSGSSGDKTVTVQNGIIELPATSVAVTSVGNVIYVDTVKNVDETSSNATVAGILTRVISGTKCWVDTRAVYTGVATLTGTNVTIADTSDYWVGSTGEAVLAEIGALATGSIMLGTGGKAVDTTMKSDGFIPVGDGTTLVSTDFNNDGYIGIGDGTNYASVDITGDIEIANTGVASITAASILDSDISHAVANRTQTVDYCFWYDFATHGGVAGAINLTKCGGAAAQTIPDNFVVEHIFYEMHAAFTSAAANVILGWTGTTNGIATTAAYDNAKFAVNAVFAAASGVPYKVDTADNVIVTPDGNLTAGTVYVYVSGHQGN
jgi:hypothetical protein